LITYLYAQAIQPVKHLFNKLNNRRAHTHKVKSIDWLVFKWIWFVHHIFICTSY